ncbi:hypothetical protein M422DRAFT_248829 [Sphaerobolus stellatus SS14]|nr:hypothetical protein M422DRAFT_248829 [Sphaerobolus stellatus SS14]
MPVALTSSDQPNPYLFHIMLSLSSERKQTHSQRINVTQSQTIISYLQTPQKFISLNPHIIAATVDEVNPNQWNVEAEVLAVAGYKHTTKFFIIFENIEDGCISKVDVPGGLHTENTWRVREVEAGVCEVEHNTTILANFLLMPFILYAERNAHTTFLANLKKELEEAK